MQTFLVYRRAKNGKETTSKVAGSTSATGIASMFKRMGATTTVAVSEFNPQTGETNTNHVWVK